MNVAEALYPRGRGGSKQQLYLQNNMCDSSQFENRIINYDCLDIMSNMPNKSVDMILCDLPYQSTARNSWDQMIDCEILWSHYKRIIKDNGAIVLTATQLFASHLISSNPNMFRYDYVWVKNKTTGFLNAKRMPLRQHELVLVFYKKLPVYNPQKTTGHNPANLFTKHTSDGTNYGETNVGISGGGQTDRYPTSILKFPVVNNDSKYKYHPTQKPVDLFEWLIRTYTNEDNVVLDNCIGSGTSAVAAIQSNRNYIGIDSDQEYCEIARKRIADTINQRDIFRKDIL